MEISHFQLFALVKLALRSLATNKSTPHDQRMRDIHELRDDCNRYMEATGRLRDGPSTEGRLAFLNG